VYATHEERIPMDGTTQSELGVLDGVRAGGLPRAPTDGVPSMAVIEDVRPLGAELERSYQVYVRGRLKFRVKQIVYVAFSLDESVMGFAFPKEERAALVASEPHKFHMPSASDMRFNWVHADLAALGPAEAREFVVDAWRMVVPKKLSRAYDLTHPNGPG
jgi:hypothetical protein